MCSSLNASLLDAELLASFDAATLGVGVAGVGVAGIGGISGLGVAGVGVAGLDSYLDGLLSPTTLPVTLPACSSGVSSSNFTNIVNTALNAVTVRANNSIVRSRRAQNIAAGIRNFLNSGRTLNSTQRANVIALIRSALNRGRIAGQLELLVDADLTAVLEIFRSVSALLAAAVSLTSLPPLTVAVLPPLLASKRD